MKLPDGVTIYIGGRKWSGKIPDGILKDGVKYWPGHEPAPAKKVKKLKDKPVIEDE